MDPLYTLDVVLNFLENKIQPPKAEVDEIVKSLHDKLSLEEPKILQIVDKLIKDGFVVKDQVDTRFPNSYISDVYVMKTYYRITFEGSFFLINPGGYVKQEEKRISENSRLDDLTIRQIDNDERLVKLTRWVAWGTVGACAAALLLLGWQVYSFYNPVLISK